jgi:hypothetical protein
MPHHDSLLHPVDSLKLETHSRILLILYLQVGGAIAVAVSHLVYSDPLPYDRTVWVLDVLAFILGCVFLAISYQAAWKGLPSAFLKWARIDPNPVEINELVISACAVLISVDAILGGILVMLTGGIFHSIFSPLLLAVVGIAFTFHLPRPTLFKTFLTIVVVVVVSHVVYEMSNRLYWVPSPVGNYKSAIITNTICATILTIAAGAEDLFNRVPMQLLEGVCDRLGRFVRFRAADRDAIAFGMRKFTWDVSRRSTSANLSRVHDLETVVEQCFVLNLPYTDAGLQDTRCWISYMTFMSHWIDDFFDHLYAGIGEIRYSDADVKEAFCKSRHLSRLRRDIRRRLSIDSSLPDRVMHLFESRYADNGALRPRIKNVWHPVQDQASSRRGMMVDRGLMRVILSGILQRNRDGGSTRGIINRLAIEVIAAPELDGRISEFYSTMAGNAKQWVIIWGSSKGVMEIFDCLSPDFNPTTSELYSLLYTPLMVFQNLSAEAQQEEMSFAFRKAVLLGEESTDECAVPSSTDPLVLGARLQDCLTFFQVNRELLNESVERRQGRKAQLSATLCLYGKELPEALQQAYRDILNDVSIWGPVGEELEMQANRPSVA